MCGGLRKKIYRLIVTFELFLGSLHMNQEDQQEVLFLLLEHDYIESHILTSNHRKKQVTSRHKPLVLVIVPTQTNRGTNIYVEGIAVCRVNEQQTASQFLVEKFQSRFQHCFFILIASQRCF